MTDIDKGIGDDNNNSQSKIETDDYDQEYTGITDLLLHTTKGKAILLMGAMYTSIISLGLLLLYTSIGIPGTAGLGMIYCVGLGYFTYKKTPSEELRNVAVFLFAILPLLVTVMLIGVVELFSNASGYIF